MGLQVDYTLQISCQPLIGKCQIFIHIHFIHLVIATMIGLQVIAGGFVKFEPLEHLIKIDCALTHHQVHVACLRPEVIVQVHGGQAGTKFRKWILSRGKAVFMTAVITKTQVLGRDVLIKKPIVAQKARVLKCDAYADSVKML